MADRPLREVLRLADEDPRLSLGFLTFQKHMMDAMGTSKASIRFLPLMASLLSLGLFWKLARRILDQHSALIAFALFAVSCRLAGHFLTGTAYSLDLAAMLLAILAALKFWATLDRGGIPSISLGLWAVTVPWISVPATVVMMGVLIILVLACMFQKSKKRLFWVLAVIAGGAVSLLLVGTDLLSVGSEGKRFLTGQRFDSWKGMVDAVESAGRYTGYHFVHSTGMATLGTFVFCVLSGCLFLFRHAKFHFCVIIVPLIAWGIFSIFPVIRFQETWFLLGAPFLFLLAGNGVGGIYRGLSVSHRFMPGLLLLFLFLSPGFQCLETLPRFSENETGMKPVLARLNEDWRAGDVLAIYGPGETFRYYAKEYGFENKGVIIGPAQGTLAVLMRLESLSDVQRLWILFSLRGLSHACDQEKLVLDYLKIRRSKIVEIDGGQVSAYLFERKPGGISEISSAPDERALR